MFAHASWEKVPAAMADELRKLGLPCPPTGQGPRLTVALPAIADTDAPHANAETPYDEQFEA